MKKFFSKIFKNIKKTMRVYEKYLLLIPFQVIVTFFLVILITNILFLFDVKMNPFILPISFILATLLSIIFFKKTTKNFNKKEFYKSFLFSILIILFVFIISLFVSSYFYETSYDGQTYHQHMILAFNREGWNSLKVEVPPYNGATWVQHYPKGAEIISASVYSITNFIETGKSINLLFILASFCTVYFVSRKIFKNNKLLSFLIALIAAFNPISIYQLLSTYVDGKMASLIIIALCFALIYVRNKKAFSLIPFVSTISLLISFKFTGLIYGIILSFGLVLFVLIRDRNFKFALKDSIILLAIGIISVFFLNLNPYYYNYRDFGHPFYPLMGEGAIDFMPQNTPEAYKNLDKFEKALASYFIFEIDDDDIIMRAPFVVERKYLNLLRFQGARTGGFGPFFMEISFVSLIISLLFIIRSKNTKKEKVNLLLVYAIIIGSVLIMPENWWPRYIPQLYTICLISLLIVFNKTPKIKNLGQLLLLLLFLNSVYTAKMSWNRCLEDTREVKQTIKKLKNEERDIYMMEWGKYNSDKFSTNRIRLEENDIEYQVLYDEEKWNELEEQKPMFKGSPFELRFK